MHLTDFFYNCTFEFKFYGINAIIKVKFVEQSNIRSSFNLSLTLVMLTSVNIQVFMAYYCFEYFNYYVSLTH